MAFGFFEGDLVDPGRAAGKAFAVIGFVVYFGIRTLAEIDKLHLIIDYNPDRSS